MAYPSTYTSDTVNQLAAALNAQRATSGATWEGGLGVDKSALYMADELAKSGITDLSQVGQGNGNIINKVTGQPLYSGYGERTGGNIWSGSYEGGGNTGFGVNFDDKGNPIFFTQGASSSTLNDDLLKAAALAAAAYGGYSLMGGESLFGAAAAETGAGSAFEALNAGASAMTDLGAFELANAGAGAGILGDVAAGTGVTAAELTAAAASSGLTATQVANLLKAGINVAGLLGATNAITNMGGGGGGNTSTPITYSGGGAGGYSPEYFSQLQSNYNSLMPNVPRDVASPLQNWYSTEFNPGASVTGSLFGDMVGGMSPARPTTLTPLPKAPVVLPPTTMTTVVGGTGTDTLVGGGTNDTLTGGGTNDAINLGSAGYQYATNQLGLTPAAYLNNINQWILDNPRASRDQIDAAMAQAGVSQADLQEALRTTTFSDATKYALTSGGSLGDLNNIITNYIAANPTATNEQIQAQQTQYGISDQDIERAMNGLNSSVGKEYAVINDMGLNQYYQNIADAAKSGISAQEAAAQMQQYGVSPGDVSKAYSLFAPSGGLTLDAVLAAYNK